MDRIPDYEYLNSCRILSGLTNKAIAENAKTSEPTISRFFRGEMKDPGAGLFAAICDTIGASSDRALGIVKPIGEVMTDPAPSIPAMVTDVMQTVSAIVDEEKLAEHIVALLAKKPIPININLREFAQEIVALLPAPQAPECESCRTARLYESTIAFHRQAIAVLGGGLGLLVLILVVMLFFGK